MVIKPETKASESKLARQTNGTSEAKIKLSTEKRLKLLGDLSEVDLHPSADCTLDKSFKFHQLRSFEGAQLAESGAYLLDY